ncbi:MAG: antibiotic biosynthesis monooxygenase [Flavobacteriales bacterium]|nr:antibiotic biosynthesis monooxygenase [Flavobacteriales bacterium]
MVTRIVKMTFRSEAVPAFTEIFDKYKERIRGAAGCTHLVLLQQSDEPWVFFTYSKWENEKFLDDYRYSATFAEVWPQVKVMFAAPAEAWTVNEIIEL